MKLCPTRYTIICQKKTADLSQYRGKEACKSMSSSQTFDEAPMRESIGGWASESAIGAELFLLFSPLAPCPPPNYSEWFLGLRLHVTHEIKINRVQC